MLLETILEMLSISSPTFSESMFTQYITDRAQKNLNPINLTEILDSIIIEFGNDPTKPHLALVGHSDVVPTHFEPYHKEGKVYGAGASDMKAGLACHYVFFKKHLPSLLKKYNISWIIYAREEGTSLEENGLTSLFTNRPDFFKSIDLAIIGEPTNNTLQLGCVGSIHAEVSIKGKASHSARPWDGKNALYEAIPFLKKISEIPANPHRIFGVTFTDVISVTTGQTHNGRTTIPDLWTCNINYRFAPIRTLDEAKNEILNVLENALEHTESIITLTDAVPAGSVIETPLFKETIKHLNQPIEAKQAWTDVAQFTSYGIPAFNFGPGLTSQAHRPDEYVPYKNLEEHIKILERIVS
jgi:succinyl-diaminopimelate desuccinylase